MGEYRIYCVVGDETRKIERLRITSSFQGQIKTFDAEVDEDMEKFWEQASSLRLFSQGELFVLRNGQKLNEKDLKSLGSQQFSSDILIDIEDENLKILPKLKKLFGDGVAIHSFKDSSSHSKKLAFISEQLKISTSESKKILNIVGTDFLKIENEIKKIKEYFNKREYSLDEVEEILIKEIPNEFKLAEDIVDGKVNFKEIREPSATFYLVMKIVKLALKIHLSGITEEWSRSYERFCKIKHPEIKSLIKEHPFFIFKNIRRAHSKSLKEIKRLLRLGLETEYKIRSGQMEEKGGIELFFIHF